MQLRGRDGGGPGTRLLPVEQCAGDTVLRVRLVQGGGAGGHEEDMAQAVGAQHRDGGAPHLHLLDRLLRLPELEEGRQ